jgi:RNA polymerase primary sigma factor
MSAQPNFPEYEDGLPSYLGRLTQAPLLSAEEEVVVTRAIQNGDQRARTRLIESNMRLVINIAKSYRSRAVPLEDLIQEGAIGLMQAAERYDPEKGFRFSTYATHWIRQAIGRAIDNKSKAIRIPAHVSQSLRRIEKERVRLARELGHDPTTEQIAAALGISPKKLAVLIQSSQELLSLDMSVGDHSGATLGGLIKDTATPSAETTVLRDEITQELETILRELSERERKVMEQRFKLNENEVLPQEELAQQMDISRERVRQIEIQAIRKLRAIAQRRRLRELMQG